jgi:ribonucleoside-triphosphate reductase
MNDEGTVFEGWYDTVDRVIEHQRWLWKRAKGDVTKPLTPHEESELQDLRWFIRDHQVSVSGRTLWLGGTEVSKRREASQFNCAYTEIKTVHDIVDLGWLLLQGCGVGFKMRPGTLNGFAQHIDKVTVVRSQRTEKGGLEHNVETVKDGVWTIQVGDSAEAWAKAIGKLAAGKAKVDELVLDFSQIRPAGQRLAGYGWICSGDEQFAVALEAIAGIFNEAAGKLLTSIQILDVCNWVGTILSSRRSAELALMEYDNDDWEIFAQAKLNHFEDNKQRAQSNNSLLFKHRPRKSELKYIFHLMDLNGGSEPGFINAQAAKKRAAWFMGVNPCAEILLGDKSFCNLVEVNVAGFQAGDQEQLMYAVYLAARANYRQTCVNLDDGILQRSWHELNEFLRLCGVGLTGLMQRPKLFDMSAQRYDKSDLAYCKEWAEKGANDMAHELNLPEPKCVTTVKPSGTLSKMMGCTEGIHMPLGKYIFNNINFSAQDPLVDILVGAGYTAFPNPYDSTSMLVTIPVKYDDIEFGMVDGKYVNVQTAIDQLENYKTMMQEYVTHNCSITVTYSKEEVGDIVDWIYDNWNDYVGVSFLPRTDASKSAKDLGFPYLPQEVVTEEQYNEYVAGLSNFRFIEDELGSFELDVEDCVGGVCPVR